MNDRSIVRQLAWTRMHTDKNTRNKIAASSQGEDPCQQEYFPYDQITGVGKNTYRQKHEEQDCYKLPRRRFLPTRMLSLSRKVTASRVTK